MMPLGTRGASRHRRQPAGRGPGPRVQVTCTRPAVAPDPPAGPMERCDSRPDVGRLRRVAAHLVPPRRPQRRALTRQCGAGSGPAASASASATEDAPAAAWRALEAPVNDIASILAQEPDPFRAMAEMRTPGVIVRGAYPPADIPRLIDRLVDRRLMRGPRDPVELTSDGTLSEVRRDAEGRVYKGSSYVRPEANGRGPRPGMGGWTPSRIDIGTSFGGGWPDREGFLAHSAGTEQLFSTLFEGMSDPVETLYECCAALTANTGQRVMVAEEAADGRRYGPAIFRVRQHTTCHSHRLYGHSASAAFAKLAG